MRVLLVVPAVDTCYEYVPPMGLMNLFLIARGLGCEVSLLDLSLDSGRRALERLTEREYDLVGVSCNFTNALPSAALYARHIKARWPKTLVVAGGNHATLVPEDLLTREYDGVIRGEGEETFRELLSCLGAGRSWRDVPGLCYRNGEALVNTAERAPIPDLDALPLNDYSAFDLKPYFAWAGIRYLNIETQRGCLYHCAFCATVRMWGNRIRLKSPARVVEEFRIARRLGCDYVFVCDDDTAIVEDHVRGISRALIDSGLNVPWGSTFGSRSIGDESTFELMHQARCVKANICVESANARLLRAYRKPYRLEDNLRTCRLFLKHGIMVHNHGIIGYPDETLREMLNTYLYLMRTSPIWHVSVLEPRPGSDWWAGWRKGQDMQRYRFFGKANVLLHPRWVVTYLLYRVMALGYFMNPVRFAKALFHPDKAVRYNYRVQYRVAWRTLRENLAGLFVSRGAKEKA